MTNIAHLGESHDQAMAKLTVLLMGVNDTGKVQNWKVAKLRIIHLLHILILVKTFIPQ